MFFFEYMIKLLMGNSNTLFMGFIMVLFGYYGWLLWNIKNKLELFLRQWERYLEKSEERRNIVFDINKKVDQLERIEERNIDLQKNLDKASDVILKEIKDETDEIKEVVKILLGQYRQLTNNSKNEGKNNDDQED